MSRRNLRTTSRFVVGIAVAGLFTGCGGPQPVIGSPRAVTFGQTRIPRPGPPIKRGTFPGSSLTFLLTDGSLLFQGGTNDWYKFEPDAYGDYANGTYTQVASLPSHYDPFGYASQVLADGRLVISGGEEDAGNFDLTNKGAIYDPVADTWTPLGHPPGWKWIGDSPSSMLPDERMLMGDKLTKEDAYLDPKSLEWRRVGDAGKADINSEEGWTLLPDGTILTIDVKDSASLSYGSQIYNPTTGQWKSAGSTIVELASPGQQRCIKYAPGHCYKPAGEIGAAMLRPDGTVFATGSWTGSKSYTGAGHTAIFHTRGSLSGTWTAGPDFPNGDFAEDANAILEPSGNVLVTGFGGNVYEWNGRTLEQVPGLKDTGAPELLPTGQVIFLGQGIAVYTPTGSPKASWAPTIKKYPSTIAAGQTYKITGTQFNGLSQGVAFGDENQNATSFPLVRITNGASGHVFYARTHDHSTMGIATGAKLVWTYFDVPPTIESGASMLVVVANGIASKPVEVTVSSGKR